MHDPLHDSPADVLRVLGSRLQVVDHHLVGVIRARQALARQVGYTKRRDVDEDHPFGQPISRPDIEAKRIESICQVAEAQGVNPHLMAGILYFLITESCKEQMIQFQAGDFGYGEVDYDTLKSNLIALADEISAKYHEHLLQFPATQSYLSFEQEVLKAQVKQLDESACALDLGCGIGGLTFPLSLMFDRVVAVDISMGMIEQVRAKMELNGVGNVEPVCADIEGHECPWGEIEDNSVDFVAMGLGMASCIKDVRRVMNQIERVLAPGGRFILSFYNTDALLYRWFSPWANSLAAVIDVGRHCLDVERGGRILSVYAKPYTIDEVEELIGRRMQVTSLYAHPTFASILPREMLQDEGVGEAVAKLDLERAHSSESDGAYIIAVGRKG